MAKVHDMAGQPAGRVDLSAHPHSDFDRRVNALVRLLMHPKHEVIFVDELRRAVEEVGDESYFQWAYYERWIQAVRVVLVERGVLTEAELAGRIAKIQEELRMSGHA